MFNLLRKMSLRSKLLLLTAFSLVALLIAFASAYRTARMSQTFAAGQVEGDVLAAVRELAGEAGNSAEDDRAQKPKRRPIPPHEAEIYARYADAPTRSVALALRARAEVSGGFCAAGGTTQAFVSADSKSANFSADERQIANAACRKILSGDFQAERINVGGETYFVAFAPAAPDENMNRTAGAFAFRRVPPQANLFGDWLSLLTQAFLLAAAVGLALFSFLVWRDWQSGMRQIESGLHNISGDLGARIEPPPTFELREISRSINDLAGNLEANRRREAELEKALARNEKLASLGRVAAGVAHEVRNPLASMKLKIQLASRAGFEKSKLEKTFGVILEEIERLDNLVRKLLDLSRPPKLDTTEFSAAGLITERLVLLSEKFAQGAVKIEFEDAAQNNFTIKADRGKMAQVLDNLFLNALEAMPNGGKMRVRIAEKVDKIEIKISDTGAGIEQDAREKIFEPFFTTKDKGTGLGLAISREITEAHGGRLYTGATETGATFVIELPRPLER